MNRILSQIDASTIRMFTFAGGIIFFLMIELFLPYRQSSVSKLKRWLNNVSLAIFNSLIINLVFSAVTVTTAHYVTINKLGLINMEYISNIPDWIRIIVILVFLDFILYIWHVLNHLIPLFWRFHRVHHSDLNMDVSTATRFHIGELTFSSIIKIAIIFFAGISMNNIIVYECAVVFCAQFHHSSLKIPGWLEAFFWILFVPPSMHRIHHSVIKKEMNNNYGTIFSFWDRIMGTFVTHVDQSKIHIGLGSYQDTNKLNFQHLMVMPFTRLV